MMRALMFAGLATGGLIAIDKVEQVRSPVASLGGKLTASLGAELVDGAIGAKAALAALGAGLLLGSSLSRALMLAAVTGGGAAITAPQVRKALPSMNEATISTVGAALGAAFFV